LTRFLVPGLCLDWRGLPMLTSHNKLFETLLKWHLLFGTYILVVRFRQKSIEPNVRYTLLFRVFFNGEQKLILGFKFLAKHYGASHDGKRT